MIYWWIERPNGRLLRFGRYIDSSDGKIYDSGCPQLTRTKKELLPFLREGERAVRVKLASETLRYVAV